MNKLTNIYLPQGAQKHCCFSRRYLLLQIDSNNTKMLIIKQHPSVIVTDFMSKSFF